MRRIVTILAVLAIIGLTMEPALAGNKHRRQHDRRDHRDRCDSRDHKVQVQVYHQSGPYVWVPQAYVAPSVPIVVRPMPVYGGHGYAHPQRHPHHYHGSPRRHHHYHPRPQRYYHPRPAPRRYYYPREGISLSWSWSW